MRNYLAAFVIVLSFMAVSLTVHAPGYEDWVPLLPASMGGINKQGDPEGINAQKEQEAWSVLKQAYSDAEGKYARLSIVAGSDAPKIQEFRKMQQFDMETEEK